LKEKNWFFYDFEAVVFDIPEEEHQRRLLKREEETGKSIPQKVIEDMRKRFEYPKKEERFSKVTIIKN